VFAQHDAGALMLITENLRARLRFTFTDDGERNEVAELQLLLAI
jgi:hypothetical protein